MSDVIKSQNGLPMLYKDLGGSYADAVYIGGAVSLPLPTGAATETTLAALDAKVPTPTITGLLPVDTLGSLGVSRLIALGSSSVNLALTSSTRRVSIHATVAAFFKVGVGAQTATTTSHYIGAGERLDFDVPASAQIAAIRSATDGVLYISELT